MSLHFEMSVQWMSTESDVDSTPTLLKRPLDEEINDGPIRKCLKLGDQCLDNDFDTTCIDRQTILANISHTLRQFVCVRREALEFSFIPSLDDILIRHLNTNTLSLVTAEIPAPNNYRQTIVNWMSIHRIKWAQELALVDTMAGRLAFIDCLAKLSKNVFDVCDSIASNRATHPALKQLKQNRQLVTVTDNEDFVDKLMREFDSLLMNWYEWTQSVHHLI
ncbi:unnamed protein product, partial [Oppiella nova]